MITGDRDIIRIGHGPGGGAQNARTAKRHDDVAVGRRGEHVEHPVAHSFANGDAHAGRSLHVDPCPCQGRHPACPRTSRVDHQIGIEDFCPARQVRHDRDSSARGVQAYHFSEGSQLRTVPLRGRQEAQAEPVGVESRVRDFHRRQGSGVEARLEPACLDGGDLTGRDSTGATRVQEGLQIGHVLFGPSHEEPPVPLQPIRHNLAKNPVLRHALARRNRIGRGIAGTGVQLALIVSRRPARHPGALDDLHLNPTLREIMGDRRAGGACTDHDHMRRRLHHSIHPVRQASRPPFLPAALIPSQAPPVLPPNPPPALPRP